MLIGLFALAALADVQGAAPIYREIKQWVVACDNTRACFAKYDSTDDEGAGGGYLSVTREAGPNGRLAVTIGLDDHLPSPAALRLDGAVLPPLPWLIDAKAEQATLEGASALRLIRLMGNAEKLTFAPGKDAPFAALNGMKAALLAIDEDQGRLDSQTALARVGPRAADQALPALPEPVVYAHPTAKPLPQSAALAAAVRASQGALLKKHDCEDEAPIADEAYGLNDTLALVLIGCIQGAYQTSVIPFIAPRNDAGAARPVIFPVEPTRRAADASGEYIVDGWDAKSATFSETNKGRGLADCGSSSAWTWDGKSFHLSAFNDLERCGGGPPGDWPTLYRTQVVIR